MPAAAAALPSAAPADCLAAPPLAACGCAGCAGAAAAAAAFWFTAPAAEAAALWVAAAAAASPLSAAAAAAAADAATAAGSDAALWVAALSCTLLALLGGPLCCRTILVPLVNTLLLLLLLMLGPAASLLLPLSICLALLVVVRIRLLILCRSPEEAGEGVCADAEVASLGRMPYVTWPGAPAGLVGISENTPGCKLMHVSAPGLERLGRSKVGEGMHTSASG